MHGACPMHARTHAGGTEHARSMHGACTVLFGIYGVAECQNIQNWWKTVYLWSVCVSHAYMSTTQKDLENAA